MWFVSNGIIECHIENLKIEIGDRTPNCLRHQVWLDVSTFNKCLFTTKPRGFLLILFCETSQIFVWRNKAFIFFQKSDILAHKHVCAFCRAQIRPHVSLPAKTSRPTVFNQCLGIDVKILHGW